MQRGPLRAARARHGWPSCARIDATIQSLLQLINDFLDFARLEGAGLKLERDRPTWSSWSSAGCIDELRPLAEARQLRCHASTPPASAHAGGRAIAAGSCRC